jgi:hypothetical protein
MYTDVHLCDRLLQDPLGHSDNASDISAMKRNVLFVENATSEMVSIDHAVKLTDAVTAH